MADQYRKPSIAALRRLEASVEQDLREHEECARARFSIPSWLMIGVPPWRLLAGVPFWQVMLPQCWFRLRKFTYVVGAVAAIILTLMGGLWWRLGNGPIELDIATPWLTAAIEENFGAGHHVEVGGTQLERDANGRTALRIRDIVVRDPDGTVVASAPKAEVGVSGAGLMSGRVRAERLSLVGAEMAVRIEPDSKITVFAGANKRPFVTASAASTPVRGSVPLVATRPERLATGAVQANRAAAPDFAALLAWVDTLGATGLDGRELGELGLKNGNLSVDDQRNGKQWSFHDINLSLTRPSQGSLALTLSSGTAEAPWKLRAEMIPTGNNHRIVDIEAEKVPARDLMLAMRLGDGQLEPDLPLSAHIRAELAPDGTPRILGGSILLEKGFIIDPDEPLAKIAIDRAEFSLEWDAMRRALAVPFQIVSGGNRLTLMAQLDAPAEMGAPWGLKIAGGTVVLASVADAKPLILNRLLLQMRVDPVKQRIDLQQGEFGNSEVGVALSGNLDYSGDDPRLAVGIAGNRMSMSALKQLWPTFISPKVRTWVEDHISGGTVERVVIATNAPMSTLKSGGPPVPDDGLSIEIAGTGADIRPVYGLPAIRDADLTLKIIGRVATVTLGRGTVEISPNRKLAIANGTFEVPDTELKPPPARVKFRLDGPVPAAAELLAADRLRDFSGAPLDPATSRGTLAAQVTLGMPLKEDLAPGSTTYAVTMDVTNFAAEKLVMGQKIEAQTLRVGANNQGYQIKGDVKISGIPANLDYRKPRGDGDAEVRLTATLDENARGKLGFDVGAFLSGPVPIKLNGRVPAIEGESRYAIEADLTHARVDRLLPGWIKPAGKNARASFTLVSRPQSSSRFEDLVLEAPGASVKGTVELDEAGELQSANFPVFGLTDGDKATVKAERGPDGTLRVTMRGEVFDGRGYLKTAMAGPSQEQGKQQIKDIDIDMKLGTVAGFYGETVRNLEVRMSRRSGNIMSFLLNGKLGRDTPLTGDLRGRPGGRNVIYMETADAGAFFRFTDTYAKAYGGSMWVAMDPPNADQSPQDGVLNVRDFVVRGEPGLDKIAAGAPDTPPAKRGVEFSRMRVEFTRSLGRLTIREGVVRGPIIGATVDGAVDYANNDVHLRGTFVPLYGLNNMFGQIPLFGVFLGGEKEGLLGLTYEVVGPPGAPVLRVNPISVAAPGLLRKFFEFPNGTTTGAIPPGSIPQSYNDPFR